MRYHRGGSDGNGSGKNKPKPRCGGRREKKMQNLIEFIGLVLTVPVVTAHYNPVATALVVAGFVGVGWVAVWAKGS